MVTAARLFVSLRTPMPLTTVGGVPLIGDAE